jgi:hypothetical protein
VLPAAPLPRAPLGGASAEDAARAALASHRDLARSTLRASGEAAASELLARAAMDAAAAAVATNERAQREGVTSVLPPAARPQPAAADSDGESEDG